MRKDVGAYRHRVTVQVVTETQNSQGEPSTDWADETTVWTSVEPLVGRELLLAQQTVALVTHRVGLRYLAGLTAKKRLVFNGRTFNILNVMNLEERNREMEIMAQEIV